MERSRSTKQKIASVLPQRRGGSALRHDEPARHMPHAGVTTALRIIWTALAAGVLWAMGGSPSAEPARLGSYGTLENSAVTVSGLSSGGFFAHQFHVAHSGVVTGAGIIAAGPFACAGQFQQPTLLQFNPYASVYVALGVCTRIARASFGLFGELAEAPEAALSVEAAWTEYDLRTIDNPQNLADDRVWLFSGTEDETVPQASMRALRTFYERLGVGEINADFTVAAKHGFPVEEFTGLSRYRKLRCLDGEELPYVIDCDRDAAGELLRHLYSDGFREPLGEPARERLIELDQREFFDRDNERTSLGAVGYLYVPAGCMETATSGVRCRLHVAFHGCQQTTDLIDDDFYWDVGYNRWAEANNIVVLYPQAVAWKPSWDPSGFASNPRGCWDWWGYTGVYYYNQHGPQLQAVRAMIRRLRGE